jgi:hypothetical protein
MASVGRGRVGREVAGAGAATGIPFDDRRRLDALRKFITGEDPLFLRSSSPRELLEIAQWIACDRMRAGGDEK